MQECIDDRGVKPFDAYDFAIPADMCLNQRMRSCAEFSLPLEFERLLGADNLDKRFGLVVHRFPPSMTNQMFEGKNGKDKADLVRTANKRTRHRMEKANITGRKR